LASAMAAARPMPRLAPVTRAIFPVNSYFILWAKACSIERERSTRGGHVPVAGRQGKLNSAPTGPLQSRRLLPTSCPGGRGLLTSKGLHVGLTPFTIQKDG
jgi:hypothetical protein